MTAALDPGSTEWRNPAELDAPMGEVLSALQGLPCWQLTGGGAAEGEILLDLGEKIRRERPIKNPHVPFPEHIGASSLFVHCPWSVRIRDRIVARRRHWSRGAIEELQLQLIGRSIVTVLVGRRDWSLQVTFDGDRTLEVHPSDTRQERDLPGDTYYENYWTVGHKDLHVSAGPLDIWRVEPRSPRG